MKKLNWVLFAIFAMISSCDVIFTSMILSKYGSGCEANPLARFVYDQFGVIGLVGLKSFSCLGMLFMVWKFPKVMFTTVILTLGLIMNLAAASTGLVALLFWG